MRSLQQTASTHRTCIRTATSKATLSWDADEAAGGAGRLLQQQSRAAATQQLVSKRLSSTSCFASMMKLKMVQQLNVLPAYAGAYIMLMLFF